MQSWAKDLEFAYDDGRLYVQDAERTWRDAAAVLPMPRGDGFFVPLRLEGWSAQPPPDLDGWDHVVEFALPVTSGALALASDGCGEVIVPIVSGDYRARWSGREHDDYRLQLWPGNGGPPAELKAWMHPADELGDLPALLGDEELDLLGRVASVAEDGDELRLLVRLGAYERTIVCDGVERWAAGSGWFGHAAVHRAHPALLPFHEPRCGLSFQGRPDAPERLLADLRAAHAELAGEYVAFDEVINAMAVLELGYGRLATGPLTLLDRYARVAATHGIQTGVSLDHAPRHDGLRVLDLEHSHVVARTFSVV